MTALIGVLAATGWLTVLGLALAGRRTSDEPPEDVLDFEDRLDVAQRDAQPAQMLSARVAGVAQGRVEWALRASDVALVWRDAGHVLHLELLAPVGVDRAGLEHRLRQSVGGLWHVRWACFPEDGESLEALRRHAWAPRLTEVRAAGPAGAEPGVVR